jgi:hypothetical protein
MKEFFDSLRQQIADRMTSPIFGSFIISWIAWNHQYLIIIFTDLPVEYRFSLARGSFYATCWAGWWHFAVLPGITSLAYILLYPHFSKPLLIYWDKQQKALADLRNEAQKKTLLTVEESQKLILDSLEQRTKFEETLARQARELDTLRNLTKMTVAPEKPPEKPAESIQDATVTPGPKFLNQDSEIYIVEIIRALKRNNGSMEEDKIASEIGESRVRTQHFIDEAQTMGLVKREHVLPMRLVKMTDSGHAFAEARNIG